jgi:hypothetical protein
MSGIAKAPLRTRWSNQALAQIAKGGGLGPSHLDCEPCIKVRDSCWSGGWEAIDPGVGVNWGFHAETEIPLCETALTLTTFIAAQSFKKLAKDCGRY